jgi:hypothetical protein
MLIGGELSCCCIHKRNESILTRRDTTIAAQLEEMKGIAFRAKHIYKIYLLYML